MKAALIATGNEIVSGQIINTNASLLAGLLSEAGLEVSYHLAVPDAEQDLIDAFDFLKTKGVSHVFTIGGLGPTRDDLTRKIVAEYLDKSFSFRDDLWVELQTLLSERIIKARDGHKWQCYFPEGSTVLNNDKGTAHGFRTPGSDFDIWCLPGPPEELRAVFENGIKPWLDQSVRGENELFTWQCTGVPESELAHNVEAALEGCSYELGFRASPPIVEVKLWIPKSAEDRDLWLEKVEKLVEKNLYSRNGQDYLKEIILKALGEEGAFAVLDKFSQGYLNQSLLKSFTGKLPHDLSLGQGDLETDLSSLRIGVEGDEIVVELRASQINIETIYELDLLRAKRSKRYRMHKAAMAIKDLHAKYCKN